MVDILAQPEQFKAELKEKWLNYYQENRRWLQHCMNENSGWCDCVEYNEEELNSFELDEDYSPRRPECYFILGVVSALEPSARSLLSFMTPLNDDSEDLVKALGLDFDPELELKKRSKESEEEIKT
ncbi:MAG: DUF5331 domain-containing protein [Xenococcaceae cyanobacterium]